MTCLRHFLKNSVPPSLITENTGCQSKRLKHAKSTGVIKIIVKHELEAVSGSFLKDEFSRHSCRRILVGRRTRLKLAECTKDIRVNVKQEVRNASGTFSKVDYRVTHNREHWLGVVLD